MPYQVDAVVLSRFVWACLQDPKSRLKSTCALEASHRYEGTLVKFLGSPRTPGPSWVRAEKSVDFNEYCGTPR